MENLTQFSNEQKEKELNVIMGLDFGTSSSKVVLQVPEYIRAYPVIFENGYPDSKFLMPTRPFFDKNGDIQLASVDDTIPLRELKLRLLGNDEAQLEFVPEMELETTPEVLTVGYLARVIQLSRTWFLKQYEESYKQFKVSWNLNLGVPSIGKQFNEIKEYFMDIAYAAWSLSLHENITLVASEKVCEEMHKKSVTVKDIASINVLQEVIAQVLGYAKSDVRKEALHMLIDIGAGTLDISTFNLFERERKLKFSIFTGEVEQLGGFEIHKNRINNVKTFVNEWLSQAGRAENPIKAIPTVIEAYVPNVAEKLDIKTIDLEFSNKCYTAVQENISALLKKYPNAPEYKTGIITFMCGGGRNIPIYQKVLSEINQIANSHGTPKVKEEDLHKPKNIESSIGEEHYHRISVAYGLSMPFEGDFDVRTPDEIRNAPTPEPPPDIRDAYPYDDIN
ncbi:MAG: hypothetical protein K8I03_09525 [Ignavibacteria bacterium]|nr:hypothetical protein [Ignavibacteria bacterium]